MSYNFYPGPSAVYPEIKNYLTDAYEEGILSIQHRSPRFIEISRSVQELLREKLNVPDGYQTFYISSSTEGWEIVNQAYPKANSYHFFNGAFGEKWMQYRKVLYPKTTHSIPFEINELPPLEKVIPSGESNIFCFTQNETATATQVPMKTLRALRTTYPDSLIAVDVASSFGGISLDWKLADLWFASSQKCLGMPAGLGLLVVSPRAVERSLRTGRYNDLKFMAEKMQNFQTTYTPNVLGIYLLNRLLEQLPLIKDTDQRIKEQAQDWYSFLEKQGYDLLIKNPDVRSDTVIAVQDIPERITEIKKQASEAGLILGNGYGRWAKNTFRIANFPAIPFEGIKKLREFLKT